MQPRCRIRVPVGYPAGIKSDTGAGEGVLLDLSPAGCRMRSDIALNTETYLALRIAVGQEPAPLAVEVSVVRWCKDGHFRVEFLRYRKGDRERVTNLVAALPSTAIPTPPQLHSIDAERRRLVIIFASKTLAIAERPYLVKRISLFARDSRGLREKRDGSKVSSSRVALVAHILSVSFTFLQTRRRSVRKDRPPRFERIVPS